MTLWVVKGGRHGQMEERYLAHSVVGIGWEDIPSLDRFQDREALKSAYRATYPGSSDGNVNVQAGQLWAFAKSMAEGDLLVVPMKTRGQIAIGTIAGPYSHTDKFGPDLRHTRSVKWIKTDIPRASFDKDLLFSFGSAQTVSRASRNEAEPRVRAMLRGGPIPPPPPPVGGGGGHVEPIDEIETNRDLEQDGRDEIVDLLRQRFKGHGLADVVNGILRAQGMVTKVSPPGADGGVDILAGGGVFGLAEPRLVVQVKSQESPADVQVLRTLKGTMSDFRAEQGLLVCWGGFKSTVLQEARTDHYRIRLWDLNDILTALFVTYEHLDEELRAELPLKRIWTVAREPA